MSVAKVIIDDTTIVDMTDATASASELFEGYTAYGADGNKIIGIADSSRIDLFDFTTPSGAITSSTSGTTKSYACSERNSVTSIHLINATSIGSYSIYKNSSLATFVLESSASIGNYGVSSNTSLTTIDIRGKVISNAVTTIANNAFNGDTELDTIIIRGPYIMGLNATGVFTGTPFASGGTGGTIYIPKSLYDHLGDGTSNDYKAATNWSTVDGYGTITWAKIEDSYYETHYADGTLIPTT